MKKTRVKTGSNIIATRFWAKVDKAGVNDCWLWTGAKRQGYGVMTIDGASQSAHRLSYEINVGPIKKQCIAHRCHNRACVNPRHLVDASDWENQQHSIIDGRYELLRPPGRCVNSSVLPSPPDDAVREIRTTGVNLEGQCEMMLKYRISQNVVIAIVRRKRFQFVVD